MAIYCPELWEQLCFEVLKFECRMPGRLWLWIRPSESVLANLQRICEVQVPGHRCQWNGFGCHQMRCSFMIYTTFQTKRPCHVFETHPLLLSSSSHLRRCCHSMCRRWKAFYLVWMRTNSMWNSSRYAGQICFVPWTKSSCQPRITIRDWVVDVFFCISEWYGFTWLLCPFRKVAMTCGFSLEQLFRSWFCLRKGDVHRFFPKRCKGCASDATKTVQKRDGIFQV